MIYVSVCLNLVTPVVPTVRESKLWRASQVLENGPHPSPIGRPRVLAVSSHHTDSISDVQCGHHRCSRDRPRCFPVWLDLHPALSSSVFGQSAETLVVDNGMALVE